MCHSVCGKIFYVLCPGPKINFRKQVYYQTGTGTYTLLHTLKCFILPDKKLSLESAKYLIWPHFLHAILAQLVCLTKHFQNLKKQNANKYTEPVFTPVFNPVPGDRVGIPGC